MFEVPNAKRVRREEALPRASSSSPPSSPPPAHFDQDAHSRLGQLLNFDVFTQGGLGESTLPDDSAQNKDAEEEEQEFEFRLFSDKNVTRSGENADDSTVDTGDMAAKTQTQKLRIRLHSPSPTRGGKGDGGFVNPFRGWEYYFSTPEVLSKERTAAKGESGTSVEKKKMEFEDVTVDGGMVLEWALKPWQGCHLPWRVVHLKRQQTKLSRASKDVYVVDQSGTTSPKSRKKPGKKRRIQLRKRTSTAEAAKQAETEKRNRKNRERKIKRRQKAREMKAVAAAQNGGAPVAGNGDGGGNTEDSSEEKEES